MKNLKPNTLVWDRKGKRQGKLKGFNRDNKTAKVEFIVDFDKENQRRTTELVDVEIKHLIPLKKSGNKRKSLKIKVKYFDKELPKIEKIEKGDWIDLYAAETVELKQGEYKEIPLNVAMELPKGYEAHVVPRSSTFKNFGIIQTNSMGVIDESYKGNDDQWRFPAYALRDTVINKGDRICQFRIMRKMPEVKFIEVEKLENKNRGGFGTTGKN